MTTPVAHLSVMIPALAIAYLLMIYGALWWWSKRSARLNG